MNFYVVITLTIIFGCAHVLYLIRLTQMLDMLEELYDIVSRQALDRIDTFSDLNSRLEDLQRQKFSRFRNPNTSNSEK